MDLDESLLFFNLKIIIPLSKIDETSLFNSGMVWPDFKVNLKQRNRTLVALVGVGQAFKVGKNLAL